MYSASGGVSNGGRIYNPRPAPAEVGPPCRVHHEISNIGEHIASSKRRIAWSFTLGDADTIHEVVLVHSVMSYKKTIEFDGRQMHYSAIATPGDWSFTMFLDGTKYAIEVRINDMETADVPKYDLAIDRIPFRRWDVYRRRKGVNAAAGGHASQQQYQQAPPAPSGGSFGTHKWGPSGMTAPPPMEPSPPRAQQSQYSVSNANAFRRDGPASSYQSPPSSQQLQSVNPTKPPAQQKKAPTKEIDLLGDFGSTEATTVSAQQLIFDPLATSMIGGAAPSTAQPARTTSNPTLTQAAGFGGQPPNARIASNPAMGMGMGFVQPTQPYVDPFANVAQPLPMKPAASINLDPLAAQSSAYMQQSHVAAPAPTQPPMGMPAYPGYQAQPPAMPRGMPGGGTMPMPGGYGMSPGYPAGYASNKPGAVNYNISHLMNPMEVNNVRNAQETKTINIDPFAGLKK